MYELARDPSHWVLPEVLAWQAQERGEATFIQIVDGERLSFAQAEQQAQQVAGCLASLGVKPGDKVIVLLPNDLDMVRVWLGLGCLGAVFVVLNTELKGEFLAHQINNCGASVAVVGRAFLPALRDIAPRVPALRAIAVAGTGEDASHLPWLLARLDGWRDSARHDGPLPMAHDLACIMYTSGTTGPSKGVLMPHAHCFLFGLGTIDNLKITAADRYYVALPLFHANALFMQLGSCLTLGITAVLRERFSASAWIKDIGKYGATVTNLIGAMSSFLFKCAPSPLDRQHKLRLVMAGPLPAEHVTLFRSRFGVRSTSAFGMTEVNMPIWDNPDHSRVGSIGRPYERYFEVSVRDSRTDQAVEPGVVGEIMVRPRIPFGFMNGYHAMPERTCEAWRNLWFHTGDAAVMDSDGYFAFVDRIKDCIRRRGQNISSFEVEAAIARLDGVAEVAAYAVPSSVAGGEDEVMLAVVAAVGATLTPDMVARYADAELPRFAWPRFIEIVDRLPKTPTARVQKTYLREQAVSSRTWDRETAAATVHQLKEGMQ
jgi:carnitine-CoA ligase